MLERRGKEREMKNCETLERMLTMSEGDRERTGKVVGRSFYNILRRNGFTHPEIMSVTGHILDEVMKDIKANGKDRKEPAMVKSSKTRHHSKEVA